MLIETTGIVEKQIAEGKTLDQIQVAGLPEKWKGWAAPAINTERWIEMVYRGLTKVPSQKP